MSSNATSRLLHSTVRAAAPLPRPESFEVYPNRDSYPFMEDYHFEKSWKVKDFVRGTIRLNGWGKAWAPV